MTVQSEVQGTAEPDYSVGAVPVEFAPQTAIPAGSPLARLADEVRGKLGDARIWHVNSTATGGGVAELLRSAIARHRLLELPATWLVSTAAPSFFELTKRIHHGLHGHRSGAPFDARDSERYRAATARQAANLAAVIEAGDLVVLHDPQTLGAAPGLLAAGARVAWRSHIGTSRPGSCTEQTWQLLADYLAQVRHCVFTMPEFAPGALPVDRVRVIRPSIDPYAPKNRDLPVAEMAALLGRIGLVQPAPDPNGADPNGAGPNGEPGAGRVVQEGYLPADAPVLFQVSRWDPLKDMAGVLRAYVEHVAGRTDAHLVLAGPDPADIPDDPEGGAIYSDLLRRYQDLPPAVRSRVHLVMLGLCDVQTNALVVNALQRRATVVCQKSLEEGFGLTVTEAMWKRRPVVASRVGGITAQITSGANGVLVDDPGDLVHFGEMVVRLFGRPSAAAALGAAAHASCARDFLVDRELADYLRLYLAML